MKLAEALSNRADLQKRISQLKDRMKESSKVQEGDSPSEDMKELMKELDACLQEQEELIYRINWTNMQTMHQGENLTQLLARRDMLTARVSLMREVLKHATDNEMRYGRSEIKFVRTIDVADFRKQTDAYCKALRELDNQIQCINWTVELI